MSSGDWRSPGDRAALRTRAAGWRIGIAAAVLLALARSASADPVKPIQVASAAPVLSGDTVEPEPPVAKIVARIDLSDQRMTIYVEDRLAYTFAVSTGRRGYRTPTGRWNAQWLSPRHRSKKYNNAPMPWSVFFYGGYAVHGTTEIKQLGKPASHGCIRLHPDNAKIFFSLVKVLGKENTLITVVR